MASEAVDARRLFVAMGRVMALQGLSLTVARGEFLAVIGPSGSGKSTLLRCLAAGQRPTSGELHVLGRRLHDASPRRLAAFRAANVGFVGQHYTRTLSEDLRVEAMVALGPALKGADPKAARKRAHELLERVGLSEQRHRRRTELSGGQQQRVALCAALAGKPPLVLADESTGELDERSGGVVLELLRELARSDNSTVVLVSHDPRAAAVADRAVTVRDGRATAEVSAGRRVALIDESGLLRFDPHELRASGISGRVELEPTPEGLLLKGTRQQAPAPFVDAPPTAGEVVAELQGVAKDYDGRQALAPLTQQFAAGELVVIAGPSGTGKTTLLHVLAGLERPTRGTVRVLGNDLGARGRDELARFRRRHIAFVPQATALTPFLSVEENVRLLLPRSRGKGAARAAIEAVGLAHLRGRPAGELSGGERQRAAMARAIATGSDLLLADEPTANLDQRSALNVARLLRALARTRGACVVVTTHDPDVTQFADRVVRLG